MNSDSCWPVLSEAEEEGPLAGKRAGTARGEGRGVVLLVSGPARLSVLLPPPLLVQLRVLLLALLLLLELRLWLLILSLSCSRLAQL